MNELKPPALKWEKGFSFIEINAKKIDLQFPVDYCVEFDDKALILLDWRARHASFGQFKNLFLVDDAGDIVWEAELPTSNTIDRYYHVQFENGKLRAYSTCSYDCEIDINTGKILSKIFYK